MRGSRPNAMADYRNTTPGNQTRDPSVVHNISVHTYTMHRKHTNPETNSCKPHLNVTHSGNQTYDFIIRVKHAFTATP